MSLSVIVIARNEASNIADCLASVSFADEVIVLDSGSVDDTCHIARAHGARVEVRPDWQGFGVQRNRAIDLSTGDWVLALDADERVTPELAAEIQRVVALPPEASCSAYEFARLSHFSGKAIRHCGLWPDHVLRLFRRGGARYTEARVHERLEPEGTVGRLPHYLLHYPYPNLAVLMMKVNRYSSDAAAIMRERGKRSSVPGAMLRATSSFLNIYLLRRGFLDGRHGLTLAVALAVGTFLRHAKLAFMQDGPVTQDQDTFRHR